jgi:ERCC4-type nuclease
MSSISLKIIFDIREASLFSAAQPLFAGISGCECVSAVLHLGDIAIQNATTGEDLLLIERKSFSDLLASIKDGRYDEQSYRLLNASNMHPHNIIYLLEGVLSNLRSPMDKKIIMSSTISLNVFKGFSIFRSAGVVETAEWIVALAKKLQKDLGVQHRRFAFSNTPSPQTLQTIVENGETEDEPPVGGVDCYSSVVKKVKKDNITADNIGAIMLCQIPGISSTIATEVMRVYGNMKGLMDALATDATPVYQLKIPVAGGKTRAIAKTAVDSMLRFLCPHVTPPEVKPVKKTKAKTTKPAKPVATPSEPISDMPINTSEPSSETPKPKRKYSKRSPAKAPETDAPAQ